MSTVELPAPKPRETRSRAALRPLALLAPRWRKIVRDLYNNRARTALVVMSIAVGVFAVGTVAGTRALLSSELDDSFQAIQPASATIMTLGPFDEDLVESVLNMPEVSAAEGRRSAYVRIRVGPKEWKNVQLFAIPDYEDISLDRVLPDQGAWPPPEREMLVERSALGLIGAEIGEEVTLRSPSGKERQLRVAGTAFDVYALPYTLDGVAWGYVTYETLEWLGEPRDFNELHLTVARNADDKDHVVDVVNLVRDKVEAGGRAILIMTIPEPGKHPLDSTIQAMLLLLGGMGALALALSGFLVTNTMSALIAQEVRNVGVMKALGARGGQILRMYIGMVAIYGLLALALAVPLGIAGTLAFAGLMGGYLNLDIDGADFPLAVIGLQAVVALVVPVLAAFFPVLRGTRITVREALSEYGLGSGLFGSRRFDRWLERIRFLSRPVILGLRNTFRRRGRLALTVTTLGLAGAAFVAVTSVNTSVMQTLDDLLAQWQWDVALQMSRSYRTDRMRSEALRVPGVLDAEGWSFTTARHTSAAEASTDSMLSFTVPLIVFAPPADTRLLRPPMVRGRWLMNDDENAVVISAGLLKDQPGLDIGGEVDLKIEGRDTTWTVVGVVQGLGPAPIVYANYDYFSKVIREAGRSQFLAIVTAEHDEETQARVAEALEARFDQAGLRVSLVSKIAEERAEAAAIFAGIIALLLSMVAILAVVGGLGLAGTMSLNVIERTREIGVMRAIGAPNLEVYRIFIAEGLTIGALSWLLGMIAGIPIAIGLSAGVGNALLGTPLSFVFDVRGALIWLGLVALIAVLASYLPARRATRVSVREVLSYQ